MRAAALIGLMCLTMWIDGATVSGRAASRVPAASATRNRAQVVGLATYYGGRFSGKPTASGVPYNANAMIAAHPSYPIGTVVRVSNLTNGRAVNVRILDRGPTRRHRAKGVVIDLSRGAAQQLDMIHAGHAPVQLRVVRWGR